MRVRLLKHSDDGFSAKGLKNIPGQNFSVCLSFLINSSTLCLADIVCIGTCRGDKGSRNLVVFEDWGLGSFSRTI